MASRDEFQDYFLEDQALQEGVRKLREICRPYDPEALQFVLNALEHTQKLLPARRHVTGRELLDGILAYAKQEFGPLALAVFEHWGIGSTEDFGRIVFKMVEAGVLSKNEDDSMADFEGAYDLKKVFETAS